jgi:hypothetical protein
LAEATIQAQGVASATATPSAAAPTPYGITPYVARAVARIQEHFRDASADPLRKGEAFVVGVFGEWGSGKSTVLDAIGGAFDNRPPALADAPGSTPRAEVTLKVEFNAWRFEREEHLLIPLLKTIQRTLDLYIESLRQQETEQASAVANAAKKLADPATWKWLLGRAQLLGACTIALTRMVKFKAGIPGLGEVEINPDEALKAAQQQIDRAAKLTSKTPTERPLESLYYDLYAHLRKLTRGLDEQDKSKLNFVFLVDDLDRCLPEKAVEMLEAIKLFLDVEGCAFVLALDDEVIERGIAHRYRDYLRPVAGLARDGQRESADHTDEFSNHFSGAGAPPITGHEYLEKIVQLPFRLPRWSKREVREFLPARYRDFLARWSSAPMDPLLTSSAPTTPDPWLLDLIVEAVPPMPRNLVRAIELLEFTRAVAIDRKLGDKLHAYPLAQLVLLQLFAPQCFRFLRRGHAEGWKTFERRLRKDRSEFSGFESMSSHAAIVELLDRQPDVSSEQFFDWWESLCRERLKVEAEPYVGRTELPLIRELRMARLNRGGFDPRNLFLTRENVRVDDVLEPYFSLFADSTTRPAQPVTPPPPAPPSPAPQPARPKAEPKPSQPAPGPAPAPAPAEPPVAASLTVGTPRDRDAFLRQLLSSSPDAWRNAISREDALIGRTLDDRTVEELLSRLKTPGTVARDVTWLETVAPLLTSNHLRTVLRETGLLRQWAVAAGVLPDGASAGAAQGMSGAFVEFARGLELVCRHLNPPHRPLPASLELAELDLLGAALRADDRRLAYCYLRGLEIPGGPVSSLVAKPIWASERGLLSAATALAEVEPGILAAGDPYGAIRLFVRAPRARWECVTVLRAHSDTVCSIIPVRGGFASAGADGRIVLYQRDARGQWRALVPISARNGTSTGRAEFSVAPYVLYALCQLDDGTIMAGGQGGVLVELKALPSAEWEARIVWAASTSADIIALATHDHDGYCVVRRNTQPTFEFRAAPPHPVQDPHLGTVTDVARWRAGVIGCTESGDIVIFQVHAPGDTTSPVQVQLIRAAGTAIRAIRVLDDERIVTWSADDQLRVWAYEGERFTLRAALDSPHILAPCLAPLCDGRVAFSESRGIAIAVPQLDATWRSQDVVSTYEFAVHAIAPLTPDRVAYVDGGMRLRVLQLSASAITDVADIDIGNAAIASLARIGNDELAIGGVDGRLRIARLRGAGWEVEELSFPVTGAIQHLSASGPFLVSGHAPDTVTIWERDDAGKFSQRRALHGLPTLSALAIHGNGKFAVGCINQSLIIDRVDAPVTDPPRWNYEGMPRHCIALQFQPDGSLLALNQDGQLTRITTEPYSQESHMRPGSAGSVQPVFAALSGNPVGERIAFARGTAPIEIDGAWAFDALHSDIRTLAAASDVLFAGGDALYVCDLRTGRPLIRRIVITDHVVLTARLNVFGEVRSASITQRDPAASWNISTHAGKSLPNDPLLHQHVAVVEPSGLLGEVFTSGGYVFVSDRRVFQVEDPDVLPD